MRNGQLSSTIFRAYIRDLLSAMNVPDGRFRCSGRFRVYCYRVYCCRVCQDGRAPPIGGHTPRGSILGWRRYGILHLTYNLPYFAKMCCISKLSHPAIYIGYYTYSNAPLHALSDAVFPYYLVNEALGKLNCLGFNLFPYCNPQLQYTCTLVSPFQIGKAQGH